MGGILPATILYTINDSGTGHVTININTSDGRTVRHLDCGEKAGGTYLASWDGRDDSGSIVTGGNYSISIRYVPDSYVIKADWGGAGSAVGQLLRPADIALDSAGNVYVVEYDNHRVQKFDASGRILCSWGGYGSGDGQFEYPAGIAVGNGIVYVADLGNSRIEMFSEDGGYISQWGTAGNGNGEFSMPHGIAIDGSGNVYVADMGNHRVQKFTTTGKYLGSIGGYGRKDGLFLSPADVAVYGNTVIVSDIDRNRIQTFTNDGAFINAWGTTGSGIGQFNGPAGLATDGWYVYVADVNNHRIQKFDLTGKSLGVIDSYGLGESQTVAPTGIATDGTGDIYVSDITNDHIQKLFYDPTRESLAVYKSTNLNLSAQDMMAQVTSGSDVDTGTLVYATAQGNGPTTYINLTGVAGNNSWYRSNVNITLNAYDHSGKGVRETKYSFDNIVWNSYYGPFSITDEGTTTLFYYSSDFAGNSEPIQSVNVRIDKTPPSITGTIMSTPIASNWYKGSVTVHFEAKDNLSGIVNATPDQTISANGVSQVIGTATDLAGNVGTANVTVQIDNEPPHTSISQSGRQGGWSNSDVKVNFTAMDGESGVKSTVYSLDGAVCKPAGPFLIDQDGMTTIYYYSTDAVGNAEPVHTATVQVDKTPPTISGHTDRPADINGWYTHDVTVYFTADDAFSGVASFAAPMTLKTDGAYQSVVGTATDKAGNTASTVVNGINIDENPPLTTCTLDGTGGGTGDNIWYRTNVTVSLEANDMGSGVHDVQYSMNGTDWQDYHSFVISKEGSTTFYYKSKDNVGNVEGQKSTTVRIDKTAPVLTAKIITNKNADGWYTEPVVIHFMATDDQSGIGSITPDITISSNGLNQSVTGYATDMAGNVGSVVVSGLNIDTSAPVTTCILNRTPNQDGWFRDGDVGVNLTNASGLGTTTTQYSFDGVNWSTYIKPITVHDQGNNVLYYYSTDNFSHTEPMNAENIRIDRTPPMIIGVPDRQPDTLLGNESWYTHSVTVHFNAFDLYSGIKSVTPDSVLHDGKGQTVNGSVMDMAGYTNSTTAGPFNVDGTPPVTTCTFKGSQNNGWYNSGGVTLSASDGNGIGVAYTGFKLDNGSWNTSTQFTIPDGTHNISYYSADTLGNVEPVHSQTVKVDSVPPKISAIRSIQPTQYGWYNNSVTIHFNASDGLSGLASVSPDVTLSSDGTSQTAVGTATDNAGNVATDTENNINIDKTAPSTNYTLEGSAGLNGWNTSNVKVSFNITDLAPLNCYHSLDQQHWSTDNPTTISTEGSLTVYYYAVDKANNTEAVKNFALKIDKAAPTVNYYLSGTQGLANAFRSDVAVGFAANDSVSGLANAYYTLDGNTWKTLANFSVTAVGDYNVQYNATDNAGNKANGAFQFSIYKEPPTVNTTTPAADSDSVYTDDQPIVTFNGRLDTGSLNNSTVTLTSADGNKVNGTIRYTEDGNKSSVTFIPQNELDPYTTYTMALSTDIKDPAGNHLASPYKWSFTTGLTDSTSGPLASATPRPSATTAASPTPKPFSLPFIGEVHLPSIPVIPLVIFIAIIAVGGAALIYLTRFRK